MLQLLPVSPIYSSVMLLCILCVLVGHNIVVPNKSYLILSYLILSYLISQTSLVASLILDWRMTPPAMRCSNQKMKSIADVMNPARLSSCITSALIICKQSHRGSHVGICTDITITKYKETRTSRMHLNDQ